MFTVQYEPGLSVIEALGIPPHQLEIYAVMFGVTLDAILASSSSGKYVCVITPMSFQALRKVLVTLKAA